MGSNRTEANGIPWVLVEGKAQDVTLTEARGQPIQNGTGEKVLEEFQGKKIKLKKKLNLMFLKVLRGNIYFQWRVWGEKFSARYIKN